MPRKNAEPLHRISVLEGNIEFIGKLIKKETKAFIALNEKVQESELESPRMIKFKITIHAVSYEQRRGLQKHLKHLLFKVKLNYLNLLFSLLFFLVCISIDRFKYEQHT